MDKGSFLWMVMVAALAALAAYNALFDVPPSTAVARFLGLGGFLLLCASLMIGPLAIIAPKEFAILLAHRRAVGIASFAFVLGHFAISFLITYGGQLQSVLAIESGIYALLALVIFVVLAATSMDWAVKNVPNWKNVQRLAYVAFIFAFYHFVMQANGLFTKVGRQTFVNISEIAMVGLGIATVALQAYGFYIVRKRQEAAKVQQKPAAPFAPQVQPPAPRQVEKVPNQDIIAGIIKEQEPKEKAGDSKPGTGNK